MKAQLKIGYQIEVTKVQDLYVGSVYKAGEGKQFVTSPQETRKEVIAEALQMVKELK